jgi:hypothetical protein
MMMMIMMMMMMIVEQLVEGMSGRGNRSTRRKPASVPLCAPQIPNDLIRLKPGLPLWDPGE